MSIQVVRKVSLVLGVLSAALGLTSEGRAGPISSLNVKAKTTFNSSGAKTVTVSLKNSSGVYQTGTYYAAPFQTTIKDMSDNVLYNTITTYCVDFTDHLNQTQMNATLETYQASDAIVNTGNSSAPDRLRNIGAAATILGNVLGLDPLNPNPLDSIQHAALQVALWEVIYDYNSADGYATTVDAKNRLGDGYFKLSGTINTTIQQTAAGYLSAAWDTSAGKFISSAALFLNYPPPGTSSNQDQLFLIPLGQPPTLPTPEPSTLAMGVVGIVIGIGTRLRRRRLAQA